MENIKNKRKQWSEQEISVLEAFYSQEGPEYCKKSLTDRSIESIKLKAQRLGILRSKFWNAREITILTENYSKYGNYECQKLLPNRTYAAINQKASELGLRGDSRIKSNEDYDNQLFEMESSAYRVEDYGRAIKPILHECIKGHTWKAAPCDILRGRGCPYCATYGFDPNKPAILYYIKIDDLYKIGITTTSVEERFKRDDLNRITVIWTRQYTTGREAHTEEQNILYKYAEYRLEKPGFLKSGGNTELFSIDVMST